MKVIKRIVLLTVMILSFPVLADQTKDNTSPPPPPAPWFTGPLLAPTGTAYPKGHIGFQPYLFYTDDFAQYSRARRRVNALDTRSWNPLLAIFVGMTGSTDLQITIPYLVNEKEGQSGHGFADVDLIFGYQALKDTPHTWIPALKLTIGEAFPTGTFENLNPGLNGADSLGAGAFQTSFAATFQKLLYLGGGHFLRTRWNFTYTVPTTIVNLRGLNSYGGAADTNGRIDLGNHFSTDLAFELTLTRHWVPAIDLLYVTTASNRFHGNPGTTSSGLPAMISTLSSEQFSIAPAMEYNFNADLGIIGGVWYSVSGRSSPDFVSGVISVVISI